MGNCVGKTNAKAKVPPWLATVRPEHLLRLRTADGGAETVIGFHGVIANVIGRHVFVLPPCRTQILQVPMRHAVFGPTQSHNASGEAYSIGAKEIMGAEVKVIGQNLENLRLRILDKASNKWVDLESYLEQHGTAMLKTDSSVTTNDE